LLSLDGQITISCPAAAQKIFRFGRRHLYKLAPSHPKKGRIAIVTKRAVGCGGRGSVGYATELQGGSHGVES
jgi:hypothetical protein